MPPKPATGTITPRNNTTKTLPADGGDCGGPPDKSGCGTVALVKPQSIAPGGTT